MQKQHPLSDTDPSGHDSVLPVPGQPIPLTADIVFKYIFGHRNSTGILRSLLSAIQTDAGFPAITQVLIENPFNLQDFADHKLSIVDVRAVDVNGTMFTVEVQATQEAAFIKRALYYWAATYHRQLGTGVPYTELQPTVGVNILDYPLFPDRPQVHSAFAISALDDPTMRMTDDLLIHMIELAKLPPPCHGSDRTPSPPATTEDPFGSATDPGTEPVSTAFMKWAYYLKRRGSINAMDDPVLRKMLQEDPEIRDAETRYREFMADPELESRYRARQRYLHQQATNLQEAEQRGIEQGIDQGHRETARKMKQMGMDPSVISKATGLSQLEVENL